MYVHVISYIIYIRHLSFVSLYIFTALLPMLQPLLHWLSPGAYLPKFRIIKAIMEGFVRERRKIVESGQVSVCGKMRQPQFHSFT